MANWPISHCLCTNTGPHVTPSCRKVSGLLRAAGGSCILSSPGTQETVIFARVAQKLTARMQIAAIILVSVAIGLLISAPRTLHAKQTGFDSPQEWSTTPFNGTVTFLSGDLTGNGRTDLIAVDSSAVWVMTSNGTGFNAPAEWYSGSFAGTKATLVGDVNGDGKADLIAVDSTATWVMTSTGSGFNSPAEWSSSAFYGSVTTLAGDVTGNGKADVIAVNGTSTWVMTSTGSGFNSPAEWSSSTFSGSKTTLVGDMTGNGDDDLVAINSSSIWVMTSTGSSFNSPSEWQSSAFYGSYATLVGDINGDGDADVVAMNGTSTLALTSTGSGFNYYQTWSTQTFYGSAADLIGDVNGDGTADLIAIDYDSANNTGQTWVMTAADSADGSGTATTSPANVSYGTSGNTITLTYTAAVGGMWDGEINVVVPPGWSAPQTTSSTTAGYTVLGACGGGSIGTISGSGPWMIPITGVTLPYNTTCTLTYGSGGGSGGGTAPPAPGSAAWSVTEMSESGGTMTALASSPSVDVLAADGSGTMSSTTANVANSATGETIPFTYTAPNGGISGGTVNLTVPSGWSAPSTTGSANGYTTASGGGGTVSASSQTVTISGVTLSSGSTMTITYGSKASGGSGASGPSTGGAQSWQGQERSTIGGTLTNLDPINITVGYPTSGYAAAAGVGDGTVSSPTALSFIDPNTSVNTESGELYQSHQDVSIPGLGQGLNLTRAYNSANASTNGPFGYGWTSNLGMTITAGSGSETITDESGAPVTFSGSGSTWTAPAYNSSTLTTSGGNWTYTRWDGDTFTFNSSGQLTSEADRNGNTTTLTYTSGQLSSVADASGRTLTFTWTGSNITEVSEPSLSGTVYTVQYGYDGNGNLTSVTNQAGNVTHYTYDSHHNLLTIEDPNGNYTTYTYGSTSPYQVCWSYVGGSLSSPSCGSPQTGSTTFAYSVPGAGQTATEITDPSGHATLDTFDHDLLVQTIAAYGTSLAATTSYGYDPTTLGQVQETDPDGTYTTKTYDGNGNVLSSTVTSALVSNPGAAPVSETTWTYNSLNEPLTMVAPNGNAASCTGSCTAAQYTTTYTYDSNGNLLTTTDPDGNVTTDTYNSSGEKCWEITTTTANAPSSPTCGSPPAGATTYSYDSYGDVTATTDGVGDETTDTYDVLGRELTEISPNGNAASCTGSCTAAQYTTTYTYDALNNQLTSWVDEAGSGPETINTYDADRNLTSTEDPLTNVTTNMYDAHNRECWTVTTSYAGRPTSTSCSTIPTGATSKTYAANGDLLTTTDADGNVTTNTYNALDQMCWSLVSTSASSNTCGNPPSGSTTYTYDAGNNLLSSSDPTGTVTTSAYYVDGKACWTYVGASTSANKCGSAPTGASTTTYDADGNKLITKDADGHTTTNTYDGADKLCWTLVGASSNACGSVPSGATSDTYDALGDVVQTTQPNGDVVSSAYNMAGEMCWTYQGSSSNACGSPPSGATTYTYDANGKRLTMVDSTGTSTWTYNNLGEVTGQTSGSGVSYTYDSNGNVTSITYPNSGPVVSQAYKQVNGNYVPCWTLVSTSASSNACGTAPTGATTYTYDANGNLLTEVLPNGVTNSYSYDDNNNVSSISDTKGATTVFSATYTRNSSEMITADTSQPSGKQSYQYTTQNQLCYQGSASSNACSTPPSGAYPYAYDAAGNITTDNGKTQAYNSSNELCWAYTGTSSNACGTAPSGATTYGFNGDGDRTSMVPSTGSATCYSYNNMDWMTEVQTGTGSSCSSPTTVATYAYNGDGLRMSKTVSGTTTNYVWNDTGSLPLLLEETSGSNVTSYIYGPTGSPLEEILPSGSAYYYSRDALGSTRALTNSSGTVVDTDTYDPYGNLTASTGSVQNNLLFDGQYYDSETGFYYLRARYYDPVTAQFTTVDPDVAETNTPYQYTAGDPINATDPSGDWTKYENLSVTLGDYALCVLGHCFGLDWAVKMTAEVWYNGSKAGLVSGTQHAYYTLTGGKVKGQESQGAYWHGVLTVWGNYWIYPPSWLVGDVATSYYAQPRIDVTGSGSARFYGSYEGYCEDYGECEYYDY